MPERKRMRTRRLAMLALALMAPLCSGCLIVAAGAAAGAGAFGYYTVTHRLYRDYPRDIPQTTAGVRAALAALRYPAPTEETKDGVVSLETRAPDDSRVSIEVRNIPGRVPADGPTSRVGIHFGVIGDEVASGRIHDQIALSLGLPPLQAPTQEQPPQVQQQLRPVPQPTPVPAETTPPPLAK